MHGLVEDPVVGDAFGAALRACHEAGARPGVVFEIVERDDGFISAGDTARYFAPVEDWPALERQAYKEFTGRVLDLGCGAGRHASVLTAAGLDAIGVDASPGAVEVARARGVEARLGSASAPPAEIAAVDTVVLFGNNLGLLGAPQQAPLVLAELPRVATARARIFASGVDPYATTDSVHIAYHDRNRQRGRMPGHLRLRVRHGHLVSEWFDYLFLSEPELVDLLRDSPWRLVDVRYDSGFAPESFECVADLVVGYVEQCPRTAEPGCGLVDGDDVGAASVRRPDRVEEAITGGADSDRLG